MTDRKRIGIAVVEHDGSYLVGVRGPDVALAGFAEFPGGKCNSNESPVDCAIRECREETGLNVAADRLLDCLEFEYAHGKLELHFFICHPIDLKDIRDAHQGFRWMKADELKSMQFPEANATVVKRLTE